jgi:hypothetical protein
VPISDNNPERRNLVVLSISIILYFLADGKITDDNVRLQVINVTFGEPEVLGKFVWVLLIWFIYKYWLNNKGSWKNGFYGEAHCGFVTKYCYPYIVKKFTLSDDYSNSLYSDRHWVSFNSYDNGFRFSHVSKAENKGQKHDIRNIETFTDKLLVAAVTIVTFIKEPSLSTYFMPYIFAFVAIIFGIKNSL